MRQSIALSAQIYVDPWSTREELDGRKKAQLYAIYMAKKARENVKPPRNTSFDGEISKRRDRT